ncbi:class I SAM-dependent methyltransferase [Methanospirillum lacunae]|uniref:Class I SAM-dependent methyltransferase n=1 Tax=Methanospirillum lacunae TaxID=668570 RepID=A0A2V2N9N8_9EURY|nr:class I SAM-dependent methyltransferase [Methanospirillum lacunae]PWR71983.1 class I SAM-dependent methyltransferase [Methanospirillum lacunae]
MQNGVEFFHPLNHRIELIKSRRFDPRINIVKDSDMRITDRDSLNRICDISEWRMSGEIADIFQSIHEGTYIHRKSWEYARCIYGLKKLGAIKQSSKAISIGAGKEKLLYYFTNHIDKIIATDLYSEWTSEDGLIMMKNPEKFAPFPYNKEKLEVISMNGTDLKFPDNTFDFAYSLSSIEHFGSRDNVKKSMSEIFRILKPNGIVCMVTELILNIATHPEFFTLDELKKYIVEPSDIPFKLVGGDLDLRISRSLVQNPIDMDIPDNERNLFVSPHIVLKAGHVIFTSVIVFLQKQG